MVDRHEDCAGSFASIPILRDAGATILAGTDAANKGSAVASIDRRRVDERVESSAALPPYIVAHRHEFANCELVQ